VRVEIILFLAAPLKTVKSLRKGPLLHFCNSDITKNRFKQSQLLDPCESDEVAVIVPNTASPFPHFVVVMMALPAATRSWHTADDATECSARGALSPVQRCGRFLSGI
jgi:hypothetical protein